MLSEAQREVVRTKGTILGRILMGLLFFGSGLTMLLLQTPTGVAGYFMSLSIPMAGIVAWLVIILKIAAGGAIMLGYRVGLAAATLILFTLTATMLAHQSFEDPGLLKNLAIVGGLLYLLAYGATGSKKPL